MTDNSQLTQAAWAVIQAASEPIRYPASPGSDALVLVPVSYLEALQSALEPATVTPERHKYASACNFEHRACTCLHPVDGHWCGKDRNDPIHTSPTAAKGGAS